MIKIFNANDRDFSTAGNIIIEPIKCIEYKKKSLNGWYIEVEMPIKYKEYISKDKLCVVKTKSKLNPQAFRIGEDIEYSTRKIKFKANHVMFDAKDYVLLDVRPTGQNGLNALNYINEGTDNVSPFSIYSNVENVNTAYFIRKNLLEAWATIEERWGGVFDADNWNISFLTSIGNDNEETIVYGKNMQGFDIYEDWSSVCTKLCPVGYDGIMLEETYLESDVQYEKPYTRVVDFQTSLETEEQTKENLLAELRQNAEVYLEENKIPKVSYTVISNINEKLEIGDTIKVSHPFVEIFTEVLEYEYDLISNKVKSLTFGNYTRDVKTKFDNIKNSINQINQTLSKQGVAIATQTSIINTLNKNGYVYIDDNEILILDALPKETAKNIWRFGLGGIGFSSNGYEGPFETAITMDGQINADFITTGTLNVSRIEGLSNFISETDKKIAEIELQQGKINLKVEDLESIKKTKTTKEGTTIEIDDSAEEPILELEVDGKSEQETRSGKNYFNANNIKNTNIIVENNGQKLMMPIDTSGNGYTTTNTLLKDLCPNLKVGDTVYVNAKSTANEVNRLVYLSVPVSETWYFGTEKTITEEMLNTSLILYGNRYTSGDTEQAIITDLMITKENDSEWEQFGKMPSPEFPSEIQSLGNDVNLFDGEIELGDINVSGNLDTITNRIRSKNYNIISPNEEYIISSPDIDIRDDYTQVFFYDENKTYISNVWKAKFTTPSNAKYYKFKNLETTDTTIKVKVQKGTVATAYSEYGKGTVEIKQCGKNFLDINKAYGKTNVSNLEIIDNTLKITTINTNTNFLLQIPINLPAGTYTNKQKGVSTFYVAKDETVLVNLGATEVKTFTIEEDANLLLLWFVGTEQQNITLNIEDFIIVDGEYTKDNFPNYEPYFENNYVIPLSQPLRSLPNGVKDTIEDGIHRRTRIDIFKAVTTLYESEGLKYGVYTLPDTARSVVTTKTNINVLCSKAICQLVPHIENSIYTIGAEGRTVVIFGSADDTVETFNAKFAGTEFIYELAEEIIEPFDEEQQAVIDSIKTNLYKQYFTSDANMRITYVRNNGLSDMYETKDSASKRYTETEAQLAELNVGIGSVGASVTEVTTRLENDYMTADQVEAETGTLKEDISIVKKQQASAELTSKGLQVQIDTINNEGVKTVKNTTVDIDEKGVTVGKSDSEFSTTMSNTGTYMYSYEKKIAKYDKDGGEMYNLKVENEAIIGYLRMLKVQVETKKRTHIHWIGG